MTEPIEAGEFGAWLDAMQRALRDEADSDVPCNGCTACCTASQFVHVDPDEADTLAHIPRELLFPAPGLPAGHMVMGHDEHGACPMFAGGGCSIYEHRPRACRAYDCRVFAAAGVDPSADGPAKRGVAERVARWRFDYADDAARNARDAIRERANALTRAATATERAVRAVRDELTDSPDTAG